MTDIKITPEIKARLEQLENENGQLTPAVVVADAKQKDSPLHGLFDWNLKEAAEKWWNHQARAIIRSVKVVITTETFEIKTPHYVRDPSADPKQQGYVSVASLQRDPVAARESVRMECARAESALNRARNLAKVLNLDEEVDQVIARVVGLREQVEQSSSGKHAA